MGQLVIANKRQSVTTIVTYCDEHGELYILLGRPDPRYRDVEGACLKGKKLDVGACQFIGGQVEEDVELSTLSFAGAENDDLDPRIKSTALKELEEEASFYAHEHAKSETTLTLIETIKHEGDQMGHIHYLNLHLGTLSSDEISRLQQSIAPQDDMIQTILMPVSALKTDEDGSVLITLENGVHQTKTVFDGFPEIDRWNENYDAAIIHAGADQKRVARLTEERDFYNRIDKEIRGLDGINTEALSPSLEVRMFKPRDPNVRTDGQILEDFLLREHGIMLQPKMSLSIHNGATLVLATRNPVKVTELQAMLGDKNARR